MKSPFSLLNTFLDDSTNRIRFTIFPLVLLATQILQINIYKYFAANLAQPTMKFGFDSIGISKYIEMLSDSLKWHLGIGVILFGASFAIYKDLNTLNKTSVFIKSIFSLSSISTLLYMGTALYLLICARFDLMQYLAIHQNGSIPPSHFEFGRILYRESTLILMLGLNTSFLSLLIYERIWRA